MNKRICSICCRGGSKGVPGKNTKMIGGKPLIAHSIQQARDTGLFEAVVVSSDCDDILNVAREYGASFTFKRPANLATDSSAKIPAIVHCIEAAEEEMKITFSTVVDLDATSPLRSVEDIIKVVRMLEENHVENVVTAMPSRRSPYFNMVEKKKDGRIDLVKRNGDQPFRRQDAPDCFDMNASIYAWQRESLIKETKSVFLSNTLLYVMPEERSIDIDSPLDFEIVEFLMNKNLKKG